MFALEIEFNDGVSSPEALLLRRPIVRVGSGDQAHVVIDGAGADSSELRIYRRLGSTFICQVVSGTDHSSSSISYNNCYSDSAQLEIGDVSITVTALDFDLALKGDESLDLAGICLLYTSDAADE